MKIRKLPLVTLNGITTKALVEVLVTGESSSEDIVRGDKIADDLASATKELLLSGEDYKFLIDRLGRTKWNSQKENRKAVSSFITTLKELKEVDVKIS